MGKITRKDRIVIKALRVEKNWSSRRFLKEFASKAWCRSSLDRLIKKSMLDFFNISITPLLVVCSLHLQKIIKFYLCIQMLLVNVSWLHFSWTTLYFKRLMGIGR